MVGTAGHLALIAAFVATLCATWAFVQAARLEDTAPTQARRWTRIGRGSWAAMAAAVVAASAVLFYLLLAHQYQYAYVYQHSSNSLPLRYLIATFWSGQEGSLLLWALMMTGVGGALIAMVKRRYENAVMASVAFCQVFLLSMIVGVHLGPVEIGSSPFKTLAQAFPEAPVFQQNPGFIPSDGQGLNDLLQNPWMTIHPPMLFAGFSAMVVPFAFAVAALWKRRYTQWVRPALPWTLFAVMILGVGLAMGGYWAYVTLSFGGYWAWDPVENSSLVPWLLGIAAFHAMLIQKKSGKSHKAALALSILAYLSVVYSTFLTRSGILGDISVHSFVSLGLYNQLLLWIVGMGVVGFGLFAYRYNDLPVPDEEPRTLSREFMIFSGAMLLCATAAVITLGTSSPIFGRLFRDTPSAVPIEFYNTWTLPLALGFVFLAGLGQLFWWHKMDVEAINRVLMKPLMLAVVSTIAVLVLTPFAQQTIVLPATEAQAPSLTQAGFFGSLESFWATYGYALQILLLVFVGFFALFGNGMVLWRIGRGNPRMAGGALTHVGFAIAMLGIVASSSFSTPLPQIGQIQRQGDSEKKQTRENFVVAKGETRMINGYRVTYTGKEPNARGRNQYLLDVTDPYGRSFTMKPVAYQSESSGQWILNPDVKAFVEQDLYTAVTPRAATGVDDRETPGGEIRLSRGDSTVIGNDRFAIAFKQFDMDIDPSRLPPNTDVSVGAVLEVTNLKTQETRTLKPIYIVKDNRSEQYIENRVADWGLRMAFTQMDASNGEISLAIEGVDVMPEDWVVVQAYEKPFISLLWIGIIVLTVGFCVSIVRRAQDVRFSAQRETPAA